MAAPSQVDGLAAGTRAAQAARRLLAARLADVNRQVARLSASPGRAAKARRQARSRQADPRQSTGVDNDKSTGVDNGPGEPDLEAVHDLRVALRRLRAAVRFFSADGPKLRKRLARLQTTAGMVRDFQLQLAWLASDKGAGARPLLAGLRSFLPPACRALYTALGEWQRSTHRQVLERARAAAPKGKLGGRRLRKRLAQRLEEAEALLREARLLEPAQAHALRIVLKKLRYETELLLPAFPQALDALLKLLAPVQESLGQLHDTDENLKLVEVAGLAAAAAALRKERLELAQPLRARLEGWSRAGRLGKLAAALREHR